MKDRVILSMHIPGTGGESNLDLWLHSTWLMEIGNARAEAIKLPREDERESLRQVKHSQVRNKVTNQKRNKQLPVLKAIKLYL